MFPAGPQLQALDRSVPRRTRAASSGSECSLPDLNCEIAVFPVGPKQQAQDRSVPRWTSTASARSQCSPPDPNSKPRVRVLPAGPQPQRISEDVSDRMQKMPEDMPDT